MRALKRSQSMGRPTERPSGAGVRKDAFMPIDGARDRGAADGHFRERSRRENPAGERRLILGRTHAERRLPDRAHPRDRPALASLMPGMWLGRERRDTTPTGGWNRKQFAASIGLLRSLGLSPRAIDHYRRLARATRRLPHELMVENAEAAAAYPNEGVRSLLYAHAGTRNGGV
jgi:hypothetical protein